MYVHKCKGTAVAQWLRCCATNRKIAGSIPASVSGFFIDIKSIRSRYGPGVHLASNRNEYQEYFLGVKAAGAYGWQPYHHPVPLSWNLGTLTSWNPLGHSRSVMGLILHSIMRSYRTYRSDFTLFNIKRFSTSNIYSIYETSTHTDNDI